RVSFARFQLSLNNCKTTMMVDITLSDMIFPFVLLFCFGWYSQSAHSRRPAALNVRRRADSWLLVCALHSPREWRGSWLPFCF
ncbi:MAG: hypothetical protein SFY80_09275, partial [Verrucomicrobiota bacterium]|nr:hypothetical protein [Verrucomicrobiota bacterium]